MAPEDDELCTDPMPLPDELAEHVGRMVAYDAEGHVRLSADSWAGLMDQLPEDSDFTVMYVPSGTVIG